MKNILLFFSFSLFMEGVFGESVSVMEGDSVTLHTGVTEIKKNDVIDWRFKGALLGRIDREADTNETHDDILDGKFRNRLKLDHQTADLTIKDIRTTDSESYEIKINSKTVKTFRVTVESVDQRQSVLVGEFVTLRTGVADTKKYDLIRWKFGPQHSTIAEVNTKDGNISTFDVPGKIFTNRLQLDYRTGSLTITSVGISHSGLYEVDIIRSSSYTIHKTFNVTVSGEVKSMSVMEGKTFTLYTYVTELHTDDYMLWMFGDTVIVSRSVYKNKQEISVSDGPDERFRDRLKLDNQTGSLTIMNSKTEDSGDYKLQISSSRRTVNKKFIVNVKAVPDTHLIPTAILAFLLIAVAAAAVVAVWCYRGKIYELKEQIYVKSVRVAENVRLDPGVTIQGRDVILWSFKDILIAAKTGNDIHPYDERFRDSLKPDGSLTITDITTEHAGLYRASMMIGRNASFRSFEVTVSDPTASGKNGAETAILLTQQP